MSLILTLFFLLLSQNRLALVTTCLNHRHIIWLYGGQDVSSQNALIDQSKLHHMLHPSQVSLSIFQSLVEQSSLH